MKKWPLFLSFFIILITVVQVRGVPADERGDALAPRSLFDQNQGDTEAGEPQRGEGPTAAGRASGGQIFAAAQVQMVLESLLQTPLSSLEHSSAIILHPEPEKFASSFVKFNDWMGDKGICEEPIVIDAPNDFGLPFNKRIDLLCEKHARKKLVIIPVVITKDEAIDYLALSGGLRHCLVHKHNPRVRFAVILGSRRYYDGLTNFPNAVRFGSQWVLESVGHKPNERQGNVFDFSSEIPTGAKQPPPAGVEGFGGQDSAKHAAASVFDSKLDSLTPVQIVNRAAEELKAAIMPALVQLEQTIESLSPESPLSAKTRAALIQMEPQWNLILEETERATKKMMDASHTYSTINRNLKNLLDALASEVGHNGAMGVNSIRGKCYRALEDNGLPGDDIAEMKKGPVRIRNLLNLSSISEIRTKSASWDRTLYVPGVTNIDNYPYVADSFIHVPHLAADIAQKIWDGQIEPVWGKVGNLNRENLGQLLSIYKVAFEKSAKEGAPNDWQKVNARVTQQR